jgi:hypothetical protein
MPGVNTSDHLDQRAAALTSAARDFRSAAGRPGSHAAAPDSLASLEDALQALSGAWYQLAADASPGIASRRTSSNSRSGRWQKVDGLSREQEVRLMGTLHDIAAAFARCARVCREGRSTAAPLIHRRVAAGPGESPEHDNEVLWFESREGTPQRVA